MKDNQVGVEVASISVLHHLSGLEEPVNPLISVINLTDLKVLSQTDQSFSYNFYTILIKKNAQTKTIHALNDSPFNTGTITFFVPGQIQISQEDSRMHYEGLALMMHPDFISSYSLKEIIRESALFANANNQALLLSEVEEKLLYGIIKNVDEELKLNIDQFTQALVLSMIELLLIYCNRINRHKVINKISNRNGMLNKMDIFLTDYFNSDKLTTSGMPTVLSVAERLNISPNYLSDILRVHTGQSTKQHIQNKLIKKAKEILFMTDLTVNEVAYLLGFNYPQSFIKLFKKKTGKTPLEFKQCLNISTNY